MTDSGKQQCIAMLYQTYGGTIYGFSCAIVKSRAQAEDILHETFLRAIRSLDFSVSEKEMKAWLFTTARHLSLDELRRGKRFTDAEMLPETPQEQTDLDETIILNEALETLDEKQKQVVLLRMAGIDYHQIGKLMEIPSGTARWLYAQAKKNLRTVLQKGAEHK